VLTVWSGQSLPDFSIIIELSPLPLLKFALMLRLISKLMLRKLAAKWGQELPRERESASTAKFGSSDRFNPRVP
jgi:hypothetical protein